MKKIMAIVLFMAVILSANNVFAGDKQRHRWQGVAMGVGAAILGSHIINSYDYRSYPSGEYQYREEGYRAPRYSCPPPCRDPYVRAYEQERERIRRQEQYRWEREQRERGRNDAREDYYGR